MAKSNVKKAAHAVEQADGAVARAIGPHRAKAGVKALSKMSEIGDQPQMLALSGAVLAAGLLGMATGSRAEGGRLARAGGRMLAAHVIASLAKDFVKARVDRTRPRAMLAGKGGHKMKKGRQTSKEETSFPSGHSAGAIAVARAYAREYPEHRNAALAAAGLVALAQIPRAAHYPSDVATGLAIGLVAEAGVSALLDAALATEIGSVSARS